MMPKREPADIIKSAAARQVNIFSALLKGLRLPGSVQNLRLVQVLALYLFFTLFGGFAGFSQQAKDIKFTKLTNIDGLSQSTVIVMYKDRAGFMWFGTEDGLNRYDGYKFTVYRNIPKDPTSLQSNAIQAIYEDRQGNFWVGTKGGGLSLFDKSKDSFIHFKSARKDKETLSDNDISFIFEDRENNLWIGTYRGLNLFNRTTKKVIRYSATSLSPNSESTECVKSIYEDTENNLWVGTNYGFFKWDKSKHALVPHELTGIDGKKEKFTVTCIFEDNNKNLYVGTEGGGLKVINIVTNALHTYLPDEKNSSSISSNIVNAIKSAENGKLWIGTEQGINIFDCATQTFQALKHDPRDEGSLTTNSVRCMLQDKQGILWVGTYAGGISKYDRNLSYFNLYQSRQTDQDGLSSNIVTSFAKDEDGNTWIGTDGGGLNLLKKGKNTFIHYQHRANTENSLASDKVLTLLKSKNDNYLWIGTYDGGVDRLDIKSGVFRHYNQANSLLSQNSVYVLSEDRKGNIWIGTNNFGVNVIKQTTGNVVRLPLTYGTFGGVNNGCIRTISEDSKGKIWIGTFGSGINVYDPETDKFSYYNKLNSGLSKDIIYSFLEDRKGNIWVGTAGGGLNLLNKQQNTFTAYNEEHGLPNNIIEKLVEDKEGNLWISTNNGISRFNPKTGRFKNYSLYNNLQSNEFVVGSGMAADNDEIYFGGINGFNVFNPNFMPDNKSIPPVVITGFELFSAGAKDSSFKWLPGKTKEIKLSYKQSGFIFEFSALAFTTSARNEYAYMLEGFDKDWNYAGNQRRATYTNMSPGTYTFRVKASNNDGVWNETGASIPIIITPPFYKTWWFIFAVSVGLTCLALALYRHKMNTVHERNAELERQVQERTEKLALKTEEERTARQEAEEANKAKSIFLATMSHEIRTPMNGVIGMAALLAETNLNDEQHSFLEVIRNSGDNLLSVINNILDFSKLESGKMVLEQHPFDLRLCVEEVLDLFAAKAATSGIELGYQMNFDVSSAISGASLHLKQVLINLVSNAMKFTSQGEIFVNANLVYLQDGNVEITIEVKDTGIGIPADKQADLFNAFTQVDSSTTRKYGGTGLGLAIAKRLVELMNGTINVKSKPGIGTTFFFTFIAPLSDEVVPVSTQPVPADLTGKKVLVAEDNATSGLILSNLLTHFNMQPVVVSSGHEALQHLGQTSNVDLVITDYRMPDMDGTNLARKIKSRQPQVPVILLNAFGEAVPDEDKTLFAAVTSKPVKYQMLQKALLNSLKKYKTATEPVRSNKLTTGFALAHPMEILVAEDNSINQFLIVMTLKKLGYEPVTANDGFLAIEALRERHFDLVLMDMQMPGMDGIEATACIRAELKNQPVIIALTANAREEDRELCLKAGMNDYISKPIELNTLISKLQKWSEKELVPV